MANVAMPGAELYYFPGGGNGIDAERARPIVIGSANSRSPPWGTPLAMRVMRRRAGRAPA